MSILNNQIVMDNNFTYLQLLIVIGITATIFSLLIKSVKKFNRTIKH